MLRSTTAAAGCDLFDSFEKCLFKTCDLGCRNSSVNPDLDSQAALGNQVGACQEAYLQSRVLTQRPPVKSNKKVGHGQINISEKKRKLNTPNVRSTLEGGRARFYWLKKLTHSGFKCFAPFMQESDDRDTNTYK